MLRSSRLRNQSIDNSRFLNPTPYQLRSLVLDYLCHSCYPNTARAFARDSAVRHLDADGDEIMQPDKGLASDAADLSDVLRPVQQREQIRLHILSGRIDEATDLLNVHFPSVLSVVDPSPREYMSRYTPPGQVEYVAPTSVDPAHLSLNLRILAFIEASRTIPLEYPPREASAVAAPPLPPPSDDTPPASPLYENDDLETLTRQAELLSLAQKLYALANSLPSPKDRATYLQELGYVGSLLAYKIPEMSAVAKYLSQERREAVADQINSAILYRTGLPAVSHLELYTRYTSTLWDFMHDLRMKPPPVATRPAGVHLPPSNSTKAGNVSSKGVLQHDKETESVPSFDLQQFLDLKT